MKRMRYQPWVGLPNILCREFVVPELLQDDCTPQALSALALPLARRRRAGRTAGPALHRSAPAAAARHCALCHRCDCDDSRKPERLGLGFSGPGLVAGVDEAGRGPLAGPVVAAAVILDERAPVRGLADSKILSARTRERLYDEIRAKALCCSIAEASVEEIDRLNILQATLLAMQRAVNGLRLLPQRVLIDGNRAPMLRMPAARHHPGRRQGAGDRRRVDPGQGVPRPLVPVSCMSSIRTTASTPTRATRRANTWTRCSATVPASRTGAASPRCARRWCWRDRSAGGQFAPTTRGWCRCAGCSATRRAYRRTGQVWLEGEHLLHGLRAARRARCARCWSANRPGSRRRAARSGRAGRTGAAAQRRAVRDDQFARLAVRHRLRWSTLAANAPVRPDARQRGPRPHPGRRQRRQHPAQRRGLRRHAGAGAERHRRAVVAEGAARRHGRALRVAAASRARSGCAGWADPAAGWRRVRTPGRCCTRRGCRARAPGSSATKGRASTTRCGRAVRCTCASRSPAARSR